MTCKMMHQICYGFYWSIKKWSKLGQKTEFLTHFEFFSSYPYELHPKVFCQMKELFKILKIYISMVSFIIGLFHRKNKQEGRGGVRIWSFQEYWWNSKQNFQGLIKNNLEFPRVVILGLILLFLRGVTQLCRVSRGEALFFLEFPRVN